MELVLVSLLRNAKLCVAIIGLTLSVSDDVLGDREQGASLLKCLIENNRLLTSYDVIVESERTKDLENESFELQSERKRLVLSRKEMIHRIGIRSRKEVFGAGKESTPVKPFLLLSQFQPEKRMTIIRGKGKALGAVPVIPEVKHFFRWPVFETVGLIVFPYYDALEDGQPRFWENIMAPSEKLTSTMLGDGKVKIAYEGRRTDVEHTTVYWLFDMKTLLPVRTWQQHSYDILNFSFRSSDESIEWKEINGLYVPVRISSLTINAPYRGDKEIKKYETVTETNFNWLSVNEPIAPEVFDIDVVESPNDVLEFLQLPVDTSEPNFSSTN